MVNEVVEIVRSNLSASLGVALETGEVDRSGMNVQCVRLSQPHRKIDNMQEELFSLIINPPGTFAEVDLTMDRQAGRLVRLIQDYVEYETNAWSDFLAIQDPAIQTTVMVNDDTVSPSDLPTGLWKALEVNARKRIPSEDRVSNAQKASHITDVAITCMSLILMTGILESFEPVDLFHAHIGGMDAFARGLKIAQAIREDGRLDEFVSNRYSSFDSGVGAKIESGEIGFEELDQYIQEKGEPELASGRQEMLENLINEFI